MVDNRVECAWYPAPNPGQTQKRVRSPPQVYRSKPWVNAVQLGDDLTRTLGREDPENMFEIMTEARGIVGDSWEGVPERSPFGYARGTDVHPQDGPCGVVCHTLQPGVHLSGRIKARFEGRNDYIIWGFHEAIVFASSSHIQSIFEPSDRPCKSKGRVESYWVGDVPDGPRYILYGETPPMAVNGRVCDRRCTEWEILDWMFSHRPSRGVNDGFFCGVRREIVIGVQAGRFFPLRRRKANPSIIPSPATAKLVT